MFICAMAQKISGLLFFVDLATVFGTIITFKNFAENLSDANDKHGERLQDIPVMGKHFKGKWNPDMSQTTAGI